MKKHKAIDGMVCGVCLFCIQNGPSYWCDEKEGYTGTYSPACEDFIPNTEAMNIYQRKFGREGQ